MDPNLQTTIIENHTPLVVYFIVGALIATIISLIVTCFSFTWKGVLAGWVILLISIGGFIYVALNFTTLATPPTNTKAIQHNQRETIEWVKTDYGLIITSSEANQLLDNAGEAIQITGNTDAVKLNSKFKFGTITTSKDNVIPELAEQTINMVYIDGDWKIVKYNSTNKYTEIKKINE